jgi:Fanconi anemia group D2 protein
MITLCCCSTRSASGVVKPYVICPLFRLVRILKWRVEAGNLEDIDALLGCGLQLPAVLQNITRGGLISMSDQLEQRVVLNSLFLAINWLREVVNAFSFSREQDVVDKVTKSAEKLQEFFFIMYLFKSCVVHTQGRCFICL